MQQQQQVQQIEVLVEVVEDIEVPLQQFIIQVQLVVQE
jgi:hypothetical protein